MCIIMFVTRLDNLFLGIKDSQASHNFIFHGFYSQTVGKNDSHEVEMKYYMHFFLNSYNQMRTLLKHCCETANNS